MKLATWIAYESGIKPVSTEVKSGVAYTDTEGYYLFMTKNDSGAVATSPIWFALGGNATAVNEKATVPTVDKEVNGGEAGSAQIGDKLPFTVTATLPGNYNSYGTYAITIVDTPQNLAIDKGTVVVKSGENVITNADGVSISVDGSGKLTVKINDLKKADPKATSATKVVVTYTATLTNDAVNNPGGNKNTISYTYSSNPGVSTETGTAIDPD